MIEGTEHIHEDWCLVKELLQDTNQFLFPCDHSLGKKRYVLVIADNFTRWVELVALSSITSKAVVKALREEWIFRYGSQKTILTDNGTQFCSKLFKDFCTEFGMQG